MRGVGLMRVVLWLRSVVWLIWLLVVFRMVRVLVWRIRVILLLVRLGCGKTGLILMVLSRVGM
ncbi:hypothetical protein FB389_1562 [Rarobacter incanus]|uniref:Uncharacterized protein n=1 Tax=Rarobacter incanus TaxID=153494 RepID=A0A542SRL7_9MICO|nr:hypothetical protein FB389_1562 [Rarobacter incanus]